MIDLTDIPASWAGREVTIKANDGTYMADCRITTINVYSDTNILRDNGGAVMRISIHPVLTVECIDTNGTRFSLHEVRPGRYGAYLNEEF